MAASTTEALFVTANVGSIFEDHTSSMLKIWSDEFLSTVSHWSPKLVALHCQEVGGKNYEHSLQHVTDFVKLLMTSEELRMFDKVRIYLDEDYSSAEHFTALGNFYFIHESIPEESVQIFNFEESKFMPVVGKEVHSGNIENVPTKEKSKFPQEIFPECKWSRKGFMRTRWDLNGTVFDLINIHLFHDASNFVAMESFPSVYCKNRQRALEHTLKRFHTDQYGTVPFFVFGDFNFRTDTQGVVKKLSEGLNAVRVQSSKSTDYSKLQYRDESSQQVVLTLGKKEFSHQDHQKLFVGEDSEWLREFDRELESFTGQLFEFSINFPPSYPYVEDSERGEMYMQTRCPSWCDRVFLSASARALVNHVDGEPCVQYGLIGQNACMGDHKPVFLQAALVGGIGTVSCCALPAAPCTPRLSATSPVEHLCRLCIEQPVFALYDEPEQDLNGLRVPTFHRHTSPYTPDSTDTEPDILEELSPSEEKDFESRRLQDMSSQRTHFSGDGQDFRRESSFRKSASKIPTYTRPGKTEDSFSPLKLHSKIPVFKSATDTLKDSNSKGKNVKGLSLTIPCPQNDSESKAVIQDIDNTAIALSPPSKQISVSKQFTSNAPAKSFIPKYRSGEGRKFLMRQQNVEDLSSDSDIGDSESPSDGRMRKVSVTEENDQEEAKVEIQFSLVESSPVMSQIECDQSPLLNIFTVGLRGSATDSGVSVSPDLSVAASSVTDSPEKVASNSNVRMESNEKEGIKALDEIATSPLSFERFSLVRRIQSASAMERKSSFPLPSSVPAENASSLTGFSESGSNLWGMRNCRCMSDGSWRRRSSTVSHPFGNSKTDAKIRLKSSSSNLDRSLPRLQSHHSSSEEDWFEEVVNDSQEDAEDDGCLNSNEVKKRSWQILDRTKRLSTHEEDVTGKNLDCNRSSKNPSSDDVLHTLVITEDGSALGVFQQTIDHAQQSSPVSDSSRAIAYVGHKLAQTCFVDTEREMVEENLLEPISDQRKEVRTDGSSNELALRSGKAECESVLIRQADICSPEIKCIKRKRSSEIVKKNKAQSADGCKACCTLS